MKIYPAIDLFDGKAVRLYKGDYDQMTVYSERPWEIACDFEKAGAGHLHLVDLEGARSGKPENLDVIRRILAETSLFVEVGGGIRNMDTVKQYLEAGVNRVIIGTAAVTDPAFLEQALDIFGEKIAVGVDLKDGYVAIKGWTEKTSLSAEMFFSRMQDWGVRTVICTDISKDGAMQGTNRELYRQLSRTFCVDIIASGGVSTMEDILELNRMGLHGAIIGKAYYVGAIDLKKAVEAVL